MKYLIILSLFASCVATSIFGLKVNGNKIVNGQGEVVKFQGIDRAGTEYMCLSNKDIFDGPIDLDALRAIKAWNVTIVRIPLNEDCWLGINGVSSQTSGYAYQNALVKFVYALNSLGMAAILDLHWTAPGTQRASGQQPMPNRDHSIDCWKGVAQTFKNNSAVIFDVFNEPYPDNNQDTDAGWECWRDGGVCGNGISYAAAGMQELVTAIRSTGATNICMLGGLEYSNDLSKWMEYKPSDPTGNLAVSWHSYNFNLCNNQQCWDEKVAPLAAQVPIIAGEIGENDCSGNYVTPLMKYLDTIGVSYLAWAWNTYDCSNFPALVSSYSGTPTNYGAAVKQHFTQTH